MKVFSQSLIENVEVFKTVGQTNSTHFLYSYVAVRFLRTYPHTIQVWGIVSFITVRSFHNLRLNKRESTPHFLFIYKPTERSCTVKQTIFMKKLLLFLLCWLFTVGCSDVKIDINQKYPSPEESLFTIDGEGNYVVEAKGGDVVVKVTTNIEYEVVIPEAASWLSLADTRAVREETLTFSVVENDDIEARMVEVLLVDADGKELRSITINQNGADPVFTIDGEGNYIVEAVGGDISVKVTTNLEHLLYH